jgi:uncharacterized membrane protein (DUF106 family)
MALEKEQRPPPPKGQFFQIFLFMIVIFFLFDQRLRMFLGNAVGFVLNPVIGFHGHLPILTILLAALVMIAASTIVRHLLVDWVKIARIQNTMRAFQKAMREARLKRDTRRIEQLTKFQTKLMGLQAELSSGQLKPMAGTMLIVIPLFAWLWQFVQGLDYQFFTAPWNPTVDMFKSTVLPHWILFYSAISIPFGTLLQKGLKYWSWKEHWHLMRPKKETGVAA